MGSSSNILSLDFAVSENEFESGARRIIQQVYPTWNQEKLKFQIFTDGITNKLMGCYQEGDPDNRVLIRINGEGSDVIINRKEELKTFKVLSANGCAPPLYAIFQNGLSYGFFPGIPLDERSVREPKIQRLIAAEMARLHHIRGDYADTVQGAVPSQYKDKIQSFLDAFPTSFDDPVKQSDFLKKVPSKSELIKEFSLVVEQLEALQMEVVFSHNDLLLKNIIYNEKKGTIHFIDYEYACYNYDAFDIGNHFCEYAGINEVDYSLYPTKEEQQPFLRQYLISKAKIEGRSEDSVTEKDIQRFYVQTNKCACAAHLMWGLWSGVQSKYSTIDFDYIDYCHVRLTEYFKRKEEFFPLQPPS